MMYYGVISTRIIKKLRALVDRLEQLQSECGIEGAVFTAHDDYDTHVIRFAEFLVTMGW